MEGFRIRRGATERRAPDAPALLALAAAGELRPTDEILTPEGWTPASALPLLRGKLGGDDPWAAWSDVDSVDAASLYRKMVDEPEELPIEAVTPMGEAVPSLGPVPIEPEPITDETARPPLTRAKASGRGPVAAVAPAATIPPTIPPATIAPPAPLPPPLSDLLPMSGVARGPRPALPPGEVGEIIDFPRHSSGGRGREARAARENVQVDTLARPRRPASPPPLVRTSRVVAMVVAGLLAVLLGYAWIRVNAFSRAGVSAPEAPVARTTAKAAAPEVSPLVQLDAELRRALPATPRAVKQAGDLSDALYVELVKQRVEVLKADGLVTKWIGRQGDEPKTAEVRIRFRSAGDMSRELGAVALVVGRYKRFYHLEVPVFEVTEETTGGVTRIDPDKAEAYYQARLTLEELLGSIAGK